MDANWTLEELVRAKFVNITGAAETLGWPYRKTKLIITDPQRATVKDAKTLLSALGVTDTADIMRLLFSAGCPQS